MKKKLFWIKERMNPQLGTYYIKMGQLSNAEAKKAEKCIYGENTMRSFKNENEYKKEIERLTSNNQRVQ